MNYLLCTVKDTTDKEGQAFTRVVVATIPSMVKVSIRLPISGCSITQEEIDESMASGEMLLVRLEGFFIIKAWSGFAGNNDGFTFGAERVIPVNAGAATKPPPAQPVPSAPAQPKTKSSDN